MKGKSKTKKGITLIALILTVVVLMILAAVAISSITNEGILNYANNAVVGYEQEQEKEQGTLGGYGSVLDKWLSKGVWEQDGTTITNKNDATMPPLSVGDRVTLKGEDDETGVEYTAGDYEGEWAVLGVEDGRLLLVSATNVVDSVTLGGKEGGNINGTQCVAGYNNGVEYLNNLCKKYFNPKYAVEARSIKGEDLIRIAKYDPDEDPYQSGAVYGNSYTYTSNFEHPTRGTASETNKITEITTYYDYPGNYTLQENIEYDLLYNYDLGEFWTASQWVNAWSTAARYGIGWSYMESGNYDISILWNSNGQSGSWSCGVRAVVALRSDVEVTKVP